MSWRSLVVSELLILIEAGVEARVEATELSGSVSEVVPVRSVVQERRLGGKPGNLILSGEGEIALILSTLSGQNEY